MHFDQLPHEPINIEIVPAIIPLVSRNEPQDVIATVAKHIGPGALQLSTLADHLKSDEQSLLLFVVWENPRGIRFRRQFRLEHPNRADRVYCYPGVRELVE